MAIRVAAKDKVVVAVSVEVQVVVWAEVVVKAASVAGACSNEVLLFSAAPDCPRVRMLRTATDQESVR
jgi:hypothetical protein